jgi:NTE family protein
VLSGGASLGAIQVGTLRALYERDITPDLIVGTSAGALNGAYIASRPQTPPTAESLARIWRGLRRGQVFPVNPVTGLLGFLGARDHLVPESGLRRLISRYVECGELEQMPVPLHVVAVDVVTGQELRLSHGRVLDAILASAAVPGVLEPVSWEGRALMDGGVANNTPISHAVELGAERIYVLPTGHACSLDEPPRGALAMALHAISLLTHRRLIDDIERHRADAHLIVMPPPCPLNIQPIDFAHATSSSTSRSWTPASSSTVAARRASPSACARTGIRSCPTGIRALSRRSRRSRRRSRRRRCGRAGWRSACRARSCAAGSPGAPAAGCCSRR